MRFSGSVVVSLCWHVSMQYFWSIVPLGHNFFDRKIIISAVWWTHSSPRKLMMSLRLIASVILFFVKIFRKNWNFHKILTKNRINIPNTSFESFWSILLRSKHFLKFLMPFCNQNGNFLKFGFLRKIAKNAFFQKINFFEICLDDP